jgi:hypothetical protein
MEIRKQLQALLAKQRRAAAIQAQAGKQGPATVRPLKPPRHRAAPVAEPYRPNPDHRLRESHL